MRTNGRTTTKGMRRAASCSKHTTRDETRLDGREYLFILSPNPLSPALSLIRQPYIVPRPQGVGGASRQTICRACGHEMISGRGWFNRAALSLPLVRYSHLIRSAVIVVASYPAPFSLAHSLSHAVSDPLGPSSSFVIAPCNHRPLSSRPSSRYAGSVAGRCYPLVVVRSSSSARCGQASKQAAGVPHLVGYRSPLVPVPSYRSPIGVVTVVNRGG